MQSVDFTTLTAICTELRHHWLPARIEQVYQCDRYTITIALRTLKQRGWLTISWHPQAARICLGDAPPRIPDTFTFSDQLRHQLNGYVLIALETVAPWERVINLQVAQRPGDSPLWHLYGEIMGKYSNLILTDADNQIITVAHQVTAAQSSVRTVQTGQAYQLPPPLLATAPSLEESQQQWQERVSLIPGTIQRQLLKNYRGLSPIVVRFLLQGANLDPQQSTASLTQGNWDRLFQGWQAWLKVLETGNFQPGWTAEGYTVLGENICQRAPDVQTLINRYYTQQLNQESFRQLHQQLLQKVNSLLAKSRLKADTFQKRLEESDGADKYRQQADLLMAHLHQGQPGRKSITLEDFATGQPVTIPLNPEKNMVQNAQSLYKLHQKLKRARSAVTPLLEEVLWEIDYLEQVQASLSQLEGYSSGEDLETLEEIREELMQQGYLDTKPTRRRSNDESQPYRIRTPSGFELWIGRNNRQNERLTFRTAGDYDLWFHSQEIPGSHVLLRLEPGKVPEEADLQFAADWTAYYSRARQSERVPVIYTQPKYVYKPKGAKPGMVVYKQERVLWGCPRRVDAYKQAPDGAGNRKGIGVRGKFS
jgi:predicted ribosome quality control (RQC) complex YloA/Tae2 family protein